MNKYLEKLLAGRKVEWKKLGEVGKFTRGGVLQKKDFTESGVGCIHYGQIYTHYGMYASETKTFVSKEFAKKAKMAKTNDLVIATTSENDEDLCKAVVWLGKEDVAVSYHACFFSHNLNPNYLAHFFKTESFKKQKKNFITGTKVKDIKASDLAKIVIPIPPMDVQEEVARVLDLLSGNIEKLKIALGRERELRVKQYEYYREKLFKFEGVKVEWKKLGEVCDYSKARISFDKLNEDNYIGVENLLQNKEGKKKSSYVPDNGNYTKFLSGDVLIGNINPYLKKIWLADCEGGCSGDVLAIHLKEDRLHTRYLYFVLSSDNFFSYDGKNSRGVMMPRGDKEAVMKYQIPIPSMEEQERIVGILDKLEDLNKRLLVALGREIELREKQYRHYMWELLGFEK